MKQNTKNRWYGNAALLLAALIWGFAFAAQSVGMDYVGPFTFQSTRSILGFLATIGFVAIKNVLTKGNKTEQNVTKNNSTKDLLVSGTICGILLTIASCLQQFGILYTTVGKAGFLTSLYILAVPLLGLFIGRKASKKLWGCILTACVGLYLLCIKGSFSISLGDGLCLLCAVCFAFQIMVIDYYVDRVDGVKLACMEFLISAVLSGIPMVVLEKPTMAMILAAWMPIAYAGIFSSGMGYTLQIVGQKYAEPTTATLLMSLESVFSVLGGFLVLGQKLTHWEAIGCVLMFAAVVAAQLPDGFFQTDKLFHSGVKNKYTQKEEI
ncbi:MAG: DMT family transporter [Lachnospiraceae bacterium]|nr:DMT family transporter [Lachnospiraceae bacterium]